MSKTFDDGREQQYRDMMAAFDAIAAKYGGVRGALLERVRSELTRLAPSAPSAQARKPEPRAAPKADVKAEARPEPQPTTNKKEPARPGRVATAAMLPSCRSCGRTMHEAADGSLVCQNGHVRQRAS